MYNDIFEIEEKIKTLTTGDYNEMISNMHILARKISSGGFLENALNEIIDQICQ